MIAIHEIVQEMKQIHTDMKLAIINRQPKNIKRFTDEILSEINLS